MGTDSFCLRWHDFESNISHGFRDIYNAKDFMDVSLVSEGNALQAHKVVLSACSSVFYDILKTNPHQHPLLYMKGVRYSDLQSILTFMYNGEVSLPQEDLNSFLEVAEELKIKGLTQSCSAGNTSPTRNKISSNSPDLKTLGERSTPTILRPSSPEKLLSPPSKRSRRGREGSRILYTENLQQEMYDDAKSIKSEPETKVSRSEDNSLLDVDSVLGGMLEADVSIREENNENLENFNRGNDADGEKYAVGDKVGVGGQLVGHQSFSGVFDSLPLDNKGMSIEELASEYLKKAATGSGYICSVCGKRVRDRYAAQDHLECQHFPSHERYTCEICGKKLHARKLYKGHKHYCQKYSSHSFSV